MIGLDSRHHQTEETNQFFISNNITHIDLVGSSLKMCKIAEGIADIYPRLNGTNEWDTAASEIILFEAGCSIVSYPERKKLLYNKRDLINYYDNHNIVILPSFTEAHPKVVDEALARYRPVIVFREIEHIIEGRSGVFVAERNSESLSKVISHIMKNYSNIQTAMKQNKLPTKENFLHEIEKILEYH